MKFLIILTSIIVTSISYSQFPKLKIDKEIYKFPDTIEGKLLVHDFVLTNIGDAPLIINDYKVACPCTKVELPKNPIAPSQSYELKVTFDTSGKSEWQDRTILLKTNTKNKEEKLRIKVYVIPYTAQ
jgi:hypothetical protein